mmetsp:Transcript_39316/g.113759  ORF Transcript_39316/g.113759 Transcript_39316/m.113759 type:complete len:256 (-) Transcript_39316:165-932(-)
MLAHQVLVLRGDLHPLEGQKLQLLLLCFHLAQRLPPAPTARLQLRLAIFLRLPHLLRVHVDALSPLAGLHGNLAGLVRARPERKETVDVLPRSPIRDDGPDNLARLALDQAAQLLAHLRDRFFALAQALELRGGRQKELQLVGRRFDKLEAPLEGRTHVIGLVLGVHRLQALAFFGELRLELREEGPEFLHVAIGLAFVLRHGLRVDRGRLEPEQALIGRVLALHGDVPAQCVRVTILQGGLYGRLVFRGLGHLP